MAAFDTQVCQLDSSVNSAGCRFGKEGISGAAAIPALDLTDDEAFALAKQRRQALDNYRYPLAAAPTLDGYSGQS